MESTHDSTTDPADRENVQLAQRRAQFTCYLKCPQRQACLAEAMAFEGDSEFTHFVWGGLLARERDNLRKGLPVVGPRPTGRRQEIDYRITKILDPTMGVEDLTALWGVGWKGLKELLREQLHLIRVEQGDPAVMLHEDVSVNIFDGTTQEAPGTVRAA